MKTLLLALALSAQTATTATPSQAPAASAPASGTPTAISPIERRDGASLAAAVEALRSRYPQAVTVATLGQSPGHRTIPLLILSTDSADQQRPAVLVLAGMDGPRWSGTEAVLVAAESILRDRPELLAGVTFYIVPRGNPDAAEAFARGPLRNYSGDGLTHDNDRDGTVDENPPVDLNGDGMITQMRAPGTLPPFLKPALITDPAEPRLMRTPDSKAGEVPVFTVWTEAFDSDGDGRLGEDWTGGIDPERNFPHRWPEFEDEAGAYPLLAPESKGLADFVIGHPNIFASLVLGRHDTVVNVPNGKERTTGGMPMMLDEADVAPYAEIAKAWRDTVGQKRTEARDAAGSFVAWMNAERGIPTFASTLWGRPDVPEGDKEGDKKEGDKQEGEADNNKDKDKDKAGKKNGKDAPKPADEEAAAWLAYSDTVRGGAGFVPWKRTEHPQIKDLEVGGWVPGFKENPPLADVAPLGAKTGEFLAKLAESRPHVSVAKPTVTAAGPSLWKIDTVLSNTGRLPTVMRGGRAESVAPSYVLRISTPFEQLKSGRRNDVVRGIDPGETRQVSWLVVAPPEETVVVELAYRGMALQRWAFRDGMPVEAPAASAPAPAKGAEP
jgi:hypothetical protein